MWPGNFLGTEAKWHKIVYVYSGKIILTSQTGWLHASVLLGAVPKKYLFVGKLVNTCKMCARECPKIALLQYAYA